MMISTRLLPAHRTRVALLILSVGLSTAGRSVVAQAPVFRAAADAVTVGVSVRQGNRPVTGLVIADFQLTDNGVAQAITAISYGKLPVDVTVVLDMSDSVSGAPMEQLRSAVSDLRRNLEPQDRLRIVTFNMRVRRILDLDAPPTAIDTAFAGVTPGGSSAVIDALSVAIASASQPDRRQFIVLFSDGKDSSSINTPADLLSVARATSPTVSVVMTTPARSAVHWFYNDLAAETGGTVVSLLPTDTLGGSLRRTLEQFRSSYVLTYSPSGVASAGAHAIDVRVKRTGVEVRARRGYTMQ